MTPATRTKRADLSLAVRELLEPHDCVVGVVAVGSVATGMARPDSDIDALVFMSPVNRHIVPAEALWRRSDDTFHSIFTHYETVRGDAIPLDLKLCDFAIWRSDESYWTEGQRAGLAEGWIAFDRDGSIARLIQEKTKYSESIRRDKIDVAVTGLDQILQDGKPERVWEQLGPTLAFDRLGAAYSFLMDLLFAMNSQWRFWPERQMTYLLNLPRLPEDIEARLLNAMNGPGVSFDGYQHRVSALRSRFKDVLADLIAEGFYQSDPISESFMRGHDEPGRAWNMDAWNEKRERKT
ncbi:MAG: nucleotidyltransferase domain-containing protein [Pseudomonadales bacterium]|jgi:predicted nucleotidyltransferase|nr:nucleotidyltransferase domain-containing protein [Pseudomonadales bacterium]MDP7357778.1 nucleotidyltransferase domain-containing protein [Pseudomonadales bacterium]MDP7595749.1 nucleotidyltransferase domain-containing protein [Pseudomonadales bacterium]HJN51954.1 nucleotidyltransferase domain-containing protein [Pseudomonadales bacterium]|tara:strand:- start:702 stop:1583 length:882 start_codon:yes stop_codon:yes gene_type:complete